MSSVNDLIGNQGIILMTKDDGTWTPLGEVTEINTITESPAPMSEPLSFNITDDTEFTMTITLTKESKKACAKILNMPKYKITEWMFPKKKKRGTKRRIRKAYRRLAKTFELKKRNNDY